MEDLWQHQSDIAFEMSQMFEDSGTIKVLKDINFELEEA